MCSICECKCSFLCGRVHLYVQMCAYPCGSQKPYLGTTPQFLSDRELTKQTGWLSEPKDPHLSHSLVLRWQVPSTMPGLLNVGPGDQTEVFKEGKHFSCWALFATWGRLNLNVHAATVTRGPSLVVAFEVSVPVLASLLSVRVASTLSSQPSARLWGSLRITIAIALGTFAGCRLLSPCYRELLVALQGWPRHL